MNYKVIITGPVGSGKTTAVNSLTDRNAMLTDAVVSDADLVTKRRKKTTTVAMDYDVVRLNDKDVIHVYGTPGQERFDFMWEILSQGANGVILLLDNTRNYPFRDLKYYSNRFEKLIKSSKLVIGVTRFDEKQDPPIAAYSHWLKSLGLDAEVVPIDAREKQNVTQLFYKVLDIETEEQKAAKEAAEAEDVKAVSTKGVTETEEAEADQVTTAADSDDASTDDKDETKVEVDQVSDSDDTADSDEEDKAKSEISAKSDSVEEKSATENVDDEILKASTIKESNEAIDDDVTGNVAEEPEEETFDASAYEAKESIKLDESILKEVSTVEHVTGVTLTSSMGELLDSTIDNEELNEFIAFLSGVTPEIESTLSRGKINRIMLRSPHDDNLTIFVENEKSLGVGSNRKKSVQALSQQIEDMLQWM